MKLKEALKRFKFLKKLDVDDKVRNKLANQLSYILKGDDTILTTPLCRACGPHEFLVDWDIVFEKHAHKLNPVLLEMERTSRSKFGPRSIAVPWKSRIDDVRSSFSNQDDNHIPRCHILKGPGNLTPLSIEEAACEVKMNKAAGIPFLTKKKDALSKLMLNFDEYLERKDPCNLLTRTQENRKTRNVWGYPFADALFEMMFYQPLLYIQRKLYYRAAVVSPDLVAERMTEIILKAQESDRWIYSVDFSAFDASVKYQYIIKAFDYVKSCFDPLFSDFISYVCLRFHSIPIVTPTGIYRNNHGVPSGSTFTNEIDSIVQVSIALTNTFISEDECQVQGDDGVYIMKKEECSPFVNSFKYAGLKLNDKSDLHQDYAKFCQNLYHIDYIKDDGIIYGIYPLYRAINRLLFQERFVSFAGHGIKGKDFYGIRCLAILENAKHHPLFEILVEFVYDRESSKLDISADGIKRYCASLEETDKTIKNSNYTYGSEVSKITSFESYKIVRRLLDRDKIISESVEDV